jgi:hypothetical protein
MKATEESVDPGSIEAAVTNLAAMPEELPVRRVFRKRIGCVLDADGCPARIYVDLARPDGSCVEIDASGWRVLDETPRNVLFEAGKGRLPLPIPAVDSGRIETLLTCLNLPRELGHLAIMGLLGSFLPDDSAWIDADTDEGEHFPQDWQRPIMQVRGEAKSGKSKTCSAMKFILDPHESMLATPPRGEKERNLRIKSQSHTILILNNMRLVDDELSDTLCRASDGDVHSERQLHTDDGEVIFRGGCLYIINGINPLASLPDLQSRVLPLECPILPVEQRLTELEYWQRVSVARPAALAAIFSAVSLAIRNWRSVDLKWNCRMTGWGKWITAAEPAFGFESGSTLKLLRSLEEGAHMENLEAQEFYLPLCKVLDLRGGRVDIEPVHLLESMETFNNHKPIKGTSQASLLGKQLREWRHVLESVAGIHIDFDDRPRGRRLYRIWREPAAPSLDGADGLAGCPPSARLASTIAGHPREDAPGTDEHPINARPSGTIDSIDSIDGSDSSLEVEEPLTCDDHAPGRDDCNSVSKPSKLSKANPIVDMLACLDSDAINRIPPRQAADRDD